MALSSKRPQVVTCPDVEEALVEWVRHMETRHGESLTGPMLKEKRKIYEELLQVPEDEQLTGNEWIVLDFPGAGPCMSRTMFVLSGGNSLTNT